MKFLIDTNVFIPVEPTRVSEVDDRTVRFAEFVRLVQTAEHQVYVHSAQREDIARDSNAERGALHEAQFPKYPVLPDPPGISARLRQRIGTSVRPSNDWVDDMLLAALDGDAVDFLVTEDQDVHRKARLSGRQDRVMSVADALLFVQRLFDRRPPALPAVRHGHAHELDSSDPIFQSFRLDYPDFEDWLVKAKRGHRLVWSIAGESNELAGFCMVKPEADCGIGLTGKVLKLCCFKVSERYSGFRYGELLLKAIFEHTVANHYDWVYVTVFERHAGLVGLFGDFGFSDTQKRTGLGELVLAKPFSFDPATTADISPLNLNIRYGPQAVRIRGVPAYVVPIQPSFHRLLFPEAEKQLDLAAGQFAFGNSIRKAYLCNSSIRMLRAGSNLLFYRSGDTRAVTALGVVESTLVTKKPENVAKFVGNRTVYSFSQIMELCSQPVLAILFRQAQVLRTPIALRDLRASGLLHGAPITIVTAPLRTTRWLESRLCA
jgi:hypothetical protein